MTPTNPPTHQQRVEEIVAGLTKAQRAMLIGAHEGAIGDGWFVFLRNGPSSKIIGNLCGKGLTEPHRINIQRLTELGLSIRTALLSNKDADNEA